MTNRITPENITSLKENEVFVFGANEAGIHGARAARIAYEKYGALWTKGFGKSKQSFAIPTKNADIRTLPLSVIQIYVNEFIKIAIATPEFTYLVTAIGTGLAGYSVEEIAPLFKNAITVNNIHLPESFWNILKQNDKH